MKQFQSLIVIFVGAWATQAIADLPRVREPTGKWLVEYALDQCLLSRAYGTDAQPLTVTFERLPMMQKVGVFVLKKGTKQTMEGGQIEVGSGDGHRATSRFSAYTVTNRDMRIIHTEVPDHVLAGIGRSERVDIRASGELDEHFAIPGVVAALRALDDCTLDLGRAWGFTIEQQKAMRQAAEPVVKLGSHFSPDDYPSAALKNGEMGRAKVRISVDANGSPIACTLTRPSGSKALDEVTCRKLMKYARFRPALGQDGKPMPSMYVTSVSWLLAG